MLVVVAGVAHERRSTEAEAIIAKLVAASDPLQAQVHARDVAYARGVVALETHDAATAVAQLTIAEASLSARPGPVLVPISHASIRYALARAYLAAGREPEAAQWFQRIIDSGYERAYSPIEYVRSFYFLGQIQEKRGDMAKARDAYRRFVGYWKDGDLDRDRIADAERKIRAGT